MISYRANEPREDEDLEGVTVKELSIDVVTDYSNDTVTSMDRLRARFPDLNERDEGRCARLFAAYPRLYLEVRRMGP